MHTICVYAFEYIHYRLMRLRVDWYMIYTHSMCIKVSQSKQSSYKKTTFIVIKILVYPFDSNYGPTNKLLVIG